MSKKTLAKFKEVANGSTQEEIKPQKSLNKGSLSKRKLVKAYGTKPSLKVSKTSRKNASVVCLDSPRGVINCGRGSRLEAGKANKVLSKKVEIPEKSPIQKELLDYYKGRGLTASRSFSSMIPYKWPTLETLKGTKLTAPGPSQSVCDLRKIGKPYSPEPAKE